MEGGSGKLKSNVMLAISSSKLRGTLLNYVRQSKYLIDINYLLGFPRIERNFLSQDGREKRKRIKKGCSQPQHSSRRRNCISIRFDESGGGGRCTAVNNLLLAQPFFRETPNDGEDQWERPQTTFANLKVPVYKKYLY